MPETPKPLKSETSATAMPGPARVYHFHSDAGSAIGAQSGYGHRMADALTAAGYRATSQPLPGPYPEIDSSSVLAASVALSRLPDGACVLIDAVTLPGLAGVIMAESRRLVLAALVSAPVWWNQGDGGQQAAWRNLALGALSQLRHVVIAEDSLRAEVGALGIDTGPGGPIIVVSPDDGQAVAALASLLGIAD